MSNQTLAQLPRQARAAVLAAGSLIIFRISGEDAAVTCKNFDATPLKNEVIGSEPLRAPVMGILDHLTRRGHNNATISAFITDYLLPFQSVLQLVGHHLHPFEFGSAECHTAHVLEGRRLLNDALYQCMQTGRSDIFVWTWLDDTGHIWEALSPHPSCIPKHLKIKASLEETSYESIKIVSCKSFKINHARRKMWNCKFPHVSTVMWPSPPPLNIFIHTCGNIEEGKNQLAPAQRCHHSTRVQQDPALSRSL